MKSFHTFIIILSIVTIASPFTASAAAADKPNVLFIAVDDLNDWIGVLKGSPNKVHTPNLDRLAARGITFTNAHCAAPACNPSRVALLSGLRPSSTGIYHNNQPWRPVLKNTVTLPQHFMNNGYRVVGGGKIYHGRYKDRTSWQEYFDHGSDPRPTKKSVNGLNKGHFDWGPHKETDEHMGDYRVASWAIKQLQAKHDKPFFIACGIYRPHLPWYAPQKYFDMYPLDNIKVPNVPDDDLNDVPAAGKKMARPQGDHAAVTKNNQWKLAVQGYLASITFADAQVGRVLDALDASEHKDNTIIVLWSDHGWHLGEKQHWRKFALWDEATRVVMMMHVPGVTKAGSTSDRPVNLIDIYPTLIDLASLPEKKELEGNVLTQLLKDPAAKWDNFSLTTHGRNNHALRSGRFRYIRYADGSEELYDHENDPMEWKNLASDPAHADRIKMFKKRLPEKNVKDAPR